MYDRWGSYCESLGHFEKARKMYNRAKDYLNLVRYVGIHVYHVTFALYVCKFLSFLPMLWMPTQHTLYPPKIKSNQMQFTRASLRLSCYSRDFRAAEAVVNESKDRCAAYHLARQFEINGDVHNAITYYSQVRSKSRIYVSVHIDRYTYKLLQCSD